MNASSDNVSYVFLLHIVSRPLTDMIQITGYRYLREEVHTAVKPLLEPSGGILKQWNIIQCNHNISLRVVLYDAAKDKAKDTCFFGE